MIGADYAPFSVRTDRPDPLAAHTRYTVAFAGVDLGAQISVPSRSDCFRDHARRAIAAGKVPEAIAAALREHGVVGAPIIRLPARKEPATRRCVKCRNRKPASEFGRNYTNKSGRHRTCNTCRVGKGRERAA